MIKAFSNYTFRNRKNASANIMKLVLGSPLFRIMIPISAAALFAVSCASYQINPSHFRDKVGIDQAFIYQKNENLRVTAHITEDSDGKFTDVGKRDDKISNTLLRVLSHGLHMERAYNPAQNNGILDPAVAPTYDIEAKISGKTVNSEIWRNLLTFGIYPSKEIRDYDCTIKIKDNVRSKEIQFNKVFSVTLEVRGVSPGGISNADLEFYSNLYTDMVHEMIFAHFKNGSVE